MSILLIASLAINAVIIVYFGLMAYGIHNLYKFLNSDNFRHITDDIATNMQEAVKEHISEELTQFQRSQRAFQELVDKNKQMKEQLSELNLMNWRLERKLGIDNADYDDIPF